MDGKVMRRWLGEFIVIVLGVLVALAVDDWVQYRSDRDLELDLVQRLRGDLVADARDLAGSRLMVERRRWILQALSQSLSEGVAPSRAPDSLVQAQRAGRPWRPLEAPLQSFVGAPLFQVTDDSFQEILATGAFRTLRDPGLRAAISTYYRTAETFAAALEYNEEGVDRFTALLLESSVSIEDPLDLERLAALARQDARLAAQGREALHKLRMQALDVRQIENARVNLESALARQLER